MSYFKKEAKENTLTRSKEDPEDQKIQRELEADASRLAPLLKDPKIAKVLLNAYSLYLDCTRLYADTYGAAIDLFTTLLAIFKNETSKEDGDTSLALMAKEGLNWVKDMMDQLDKVYAGVEAGTFPITDAIRLFIKAYRKFEELEHSAESKALS